MDLGERKQHILAAIIEEYIRTGEPVGSKVVVERLDHAVSSATVRNEMADLAAKGYLEQPHTSAGRIPTAPAFRLYIDRLMHRRPLPEESRQTIDQLLAGAASDPERLIEGAAQALAAATGCAAVGTSPCDHDACVRRIEQQLDEEVLGRLSRALSETFLHRPVGEIGLADVQGLVLSLGEHGLACAPVLTAFYELVQEAAAAEVLLTGQLNLLQHPDYEVSHARALLHFLARRDLVADMLTAYPGGLRVVLGNESDRPELSGSSIIITRYALEDGMTGTIGLIGPLRMDYATAIPRLEYYSSRVGKLLTELLNE